MYEYTPEDVRKVVDYVDAKFRQAVVDDNLREVFLNERRYMVR
jgi:hypothetical protein